MSDFSIVLKKLWPNGDQKVPGLVAGIAATGTVSGIANIDFTLPDALPGVAIEMSGLYPAFAGDYLILRAGAGGAPSVASEYTGNTILNNASAAVVNTYSSATSLHLERRSWSTLQRAFLVGLNLARAAGFSFASKMSNYNSALAVQTDIVSGGYMQNGVTVDTIRLAYTNGNMSAANIALIGMAA